MAKFKVRVTQGLRTMRTTIMEVEAEDAAAAVAMVDEGDVDKPTEASAWTRMEVLEHEHCEWVK